MFNAANTIKLSVSAPSIRFVVVDLPKMDDEDVELTPQQLSDASQTVRRALNTWLYEQA